MASTACVEGCASVLKPDVLLVAENGHSGGIGRYCVDLARALGDRASVVCLCPETCPGAPHCWLADQCEARGVGLIPIAMPARAWRKGFRELEAVWKTEGRPIVHVNGRRGNFLAVLGKSRFPGFTFVTTVHGVLGLHARRNAAYRVVDFAASQAANAVIAVSADTRRRLAAAGVPSKKTLTISNGLSSDDMGLLTTIANDRARIAQTARPVRIGFLGRLSPEKGIDEFLLLARRLSAHVGGQYFRVAGSGPSLLRFTEESAQLVAEGLLEYVGDTSDPAGFLGDIDILVMPSHNEGLPYVLLEALAAGCAVVAYGVGGIPEVITDASLGTLVRPRDFDALLTAVSDLVANPALRTSIGRSASHMVRERYALARRLPLLSKAYETCDPERAGRVPRAAGCEEDDAPCAP